MFGDMLQMMTAGKRVEYNGEQWILISNTMMRTTDNESLCVAIRSTDTFPAPTYVIPVAPGVHLRSNSGGRGPRDESVLAQAADVREEEVCPA